MFLHNMHDFIRAGAIASGLLAGGNRVGSVASKGADLVELAAAGGADNVLQRLVPHQWAHYAAKDGPKFATSTFVGSTLYVLTGLFMLIFALRALCLLVVRVVKLLLAVILPKAKRD